MSKPDLTNVVENIRDIAYVSSLDGTISYINQRVTDYGYRPQDIVGHNLAEFVHPDDLARVLGEMQKMLASGRDFPTVLRLRKRDGAYVDVEDLSRVVVQAGGETMIVGTIRDITERRKLENELLRGEERFRRVAESAGEWIWEVDRDGLYTYASPIAEKMLGYKPEEIVGKMHFYDFFPPEDQKSGKEQALGVFARREAFHKFVNRLRRRDGGQVTVETSGFPIIDDKNELAGYRGVDSDVTERQKKDQEFNEHVAELEVFHHATVGRELRMIELEKEVNGLLAQLGKEPKYQ